MALSDDQPSHLEPSELGTKEYWQQAYTRELANNAADPTDEGTVWFDDTGAEDKMLRFLETLSPAPPRAAAGNSESLLECELVRILDLGTGNGHLLFAMQDEGWLGGLVGADYSARSIELAQQIQSRRQLDEEVDFAAKNNDKQLRFVEWDLLKEPLPQEWPLDGFDIVLDKGTFDAISLGDEVVDGQGRKGCEVYPERAKELVSVGGYLLITSCNWTEAELRKWFEGQCFSHHATLRYPSFTFGGQSGQSVSSVCFRRR